ncbi:TetR/AcrR family transcriptional regulator [Actinomadura barringtoniae]|uniref:TetR/AcrR family transcriptional regulator n=1 Tax=Actinomadura barringtoniae TaxID=1427535 RepID=A0A939PB88_9ACTN|nr:TetR/AcrR family transcriptional regulator [Actinomadura barringtoniae]MBO2449430.1 TetR/AcrR family transcriptional regulator [Actinomadura barringtoniae]
MTQSRGRGRPRDPQVDEAILEAALELFIEKGAEATSIEQIARRAGVGKLSLYRRWETKEELLAAAIENARSHMPDVELWDSGEKLAIDIVLDAVSATLADPRARGLLAQLIGSSQTHPSLLATYWKHYLGPRRELGGALLRGDDDRDVTMDMLIGTAFYRVLVHPDELTPAEIRAYLVHLVDRMGVEI